MDRRTFLQAAAAAGANPVLRRIASTDDRVRKMIGIQLGAISFLDEGVEQVLDIVQERASANALFLATFSFSNGTAGRQLPGHPFPGHGKQEYDTDLRGGNFARVHPQYYRDSGIDPGATQAPDYDRFDLLAEVTPQARNRGMGVFCLVQDQFPSNFPGIEKLQEHDFNGQRAETLCKNNPYYRNFLAGLMEDLTRSYDIDGVMFVCEYQGAFSNTIGSRFRGKARGKPGSRTCFCPFCKEKAKQQGIRLDRVQQGFLELEKFVAAGRSRQVLPDGYYVSLWRLVLRYPELLAWEHLFHTGVREVYAIMRERLKSVKQKASFGLHVWHNATMSPIYRAEQDLEELSRTSDFLKLALYHNCGGPRLASYIESVGETMYGDIPPRELLEFHYRVLDYTGTPYPAVRKTGLRADYVYREAKRGVDQARSAPVYAGIDVDIPVEDADLQKQDRDAAQSTRQEIRSAVREAFRAGVQGIVISRKYSEMRLESLSGVGDAVKELGLQIS
ncbi:MAG: hypothetical protein EHM61_26135 [Acidobacteria bacterium]|nr:MAG: hypothetical protein EHM61_26135 [Acidobacteriota bacterium]